LSLRVGGTMAVTDGWAEGPAVGVPVALPDGVTAGVGPFVPGSTPAVSWLPRPSAASMAVCIRLSWNTDAMPVSGLVRPIITDRPEP